MIEDEKKRETLSRVPPRPQPRTCLDAPSPGLFPPPDGVPEADPRVTRTGLLVDAHARGPTTGGGGGGIGAVAVVAVVVGVAIIVVGGVGVVIVAIGFWFFPPLLSRAIFFILTLKEKKKKSLGGHAEPRFDDEVEWIRSRKSR